MILEARDLSIGYPDHMVGQGLNVAVRKGEVLALLGPNGSGKTTLLKTLLGLLPAKRGDVHIDGALLSSRSSRERARLLGYVPQSHAATFAFTVEAVVLMGRTPYGNLFSGPTPRDREVTSALLDHFGILPLAERPYTMISGGERQLALLARALAQEPHFVILDEPTASLDFGNQGKVMREMRALAQAGHGVLFTTHDPNQALRYATRAMLLRDGACLAEGSVEQVVTRAGLEALYRTEIEEVADPANGGRAFLPH